MKKFFALLVSVVLSFACALNVFAYDGMMAGEKKLNVAQTQWFDIIYGESCVESAAVMYANADKIYQDLADMYGWEEPPVRMPLVLTTNVELYNAYFSNGYYNHIVLYVAPPAEELLVQPDTLLGTFRHELTHAFTYNMKNKSWRVLSNIWGEMMSCSFLTVTSGMAEGATVTSESYSGNGRLNNEFTKHLVKQAKIENVFPEFSDVQGARDVYNRGSFYFFNGAFHEYLQKTYGMEKYADFWYNCINNKVTIGGAFKKSYGMKIRDAWDDFAADYKVPAVKTNPVLSGLASDFFNPDASSYSDMNNKGALYEQLSVSSRGLTYVNGNNNSVYFVKASNLGGSNVKPQKLFDLSYIESARQSVDGKYIAVSSYDEKGSSYKYRVQIYDVDSKKWIKVPGTGLKDAAVVKKGGEYFLVSMRFAGEDEKISIMKIGSGKVQVEDEVLVPTSRNDFPYSFTQSADGEFAFIEKTQMNYRVVRMDLEGNVVKEYFAEVDSTMPHFAMRYLASELDAQGSVGGRLYFSWVSEGTMPRLGRLDLASGKFDFSDGDYSGGVWFPGVVDSKVYYVGQFYEQNRIFAKDADSFGAYTSIAAGSGSKVKAESLAAAVQDKKWIEEFSDVEAKNYNPFKYFKGYIIPLGQLTDNSYDQEHASQYAMNTGLTLMTANPWDANVLMLSVGWGWLTSSEGVSVTVTGGTDSSLFKYQLGGKAIFDPKGWKSADVETGFSLNKAFGKNSSIVFSPSNLFHIGRSNANIDELVAAGIVTDPEEILGAFVQPIGLFASISDDIFLMDQVSAMLYWSNIHKAGDSRFAKAGLMAGVMPFAKYGYNLTQNVEEVLSYDMCLFAQAYVPRLLPIQCVGNSTYNLPTKFYASAFHSYMVQQNFTNSGVVPSLACVGFETVLYGREIQKAIPFLPFIYMGDLRVSLSALCGYDYPSGISDVMSLLNTADYIQQIMDLGAQPLFDATLKVSLGCSPLNFGTLTNRKINLSAGFNVSYVYGDWQPKGVVNMDIAF